MSTRTYPKYKDSGVEWLGTVPEHWEVKAIKWATSVQRGASPRPIEDPRYFDDEGEFAWVRISDVTASDVYLMETTQRLSELGANLSVKMQPGSLFLSIAGSVGKACIASIQCCIHDGFVYFPTLKDDTKFLFYIFAAGEAYKGLGKLGTQLNLNTDTIGSIKIGFPPLAEQRAIAAFLDRETARLDTLMAKQERLIELSLEKRRALISHTVTRGLNANAPLKDSGVEWLGQVPQHWEIWKMAHAFSDIGSGTTPPSDEPIWYEGDIPWVTTGELRENVINETTKCVSKEALSTFGSLKLHPAKSIVIAMYGATIGRLGILGVDAVTNQACCVIANSKVVLQPFLYYWLFGFRDEIISLSVGGGQPNINQEIISHLRISTPPLSEQRAIVEYLDAETAKIDTLISKARRAIELMREHRTSLIAAAVTGKIDVRHLVAS